MHIVLQHIPKFQGIHSTGGGRASREGMQSTRVGGQPYWARTEKAYFDDLGAAITQKLTAGHAVIVEGDINIDRKREKEFREWLTEVGMVDTGAEDKLDTFRHASGSGSRLDFILLSQARSQPSTADQA